MVATEMGEMGFRELKKMGIDVSSYAISVEQSTQGIKDVVRRLSGKHVRCSTPSQTNLIMNRFKQQRSRMQAENLLHTMDLSWRGRKSRSSDLESSELALRKNA